MGRLIQRGKSPLLTFELLSWMLLMFCSFSRRNEDAMVDAPNLIVVKKSMRAELFQSSQCDRSRDWEFPSWVSRSLLQCGKVPNLENPAFEMKSARIFIVVSTEDVVLV